MRDEPEARERLPARFGVGRGPQKLFVQLMRLTRPPGAKRCRSLLRQRTLLTLRDCALEFDVGAHPRLPNYLFSASPPSQGRPPTSAAIATRRRHNRISPAS